jgi:hypothetical protein
MNLAKIKFIGKAFIKGGETEGFLEKIGLFPILWEPFKVTAPSRMELLAIQKFAKIAHSSVHDLLFTTYSC